MGYQEWQRAERGWDDQLLLQLLQTDSTDNDKLPTMKLDGGVGCWITSYDTIVLIIRYGSIRSRERERERDIRSDNSRSHDAAPESGGIITAFVRYFICRFITYSNINPHGRSLLHTSWRRIWFSETQNSIC